MISLFEWNFDSKARFIIQSLFVVITLVPYIYLVFLDFKDKSMEYWKILAAIAFNLMVFIPVAIWIDIKAILYLVATVVIFLILSLLNGKINKEKVIGQADIDVIIMQGLITASIVLMSSSNLTERFTLYLNAAVITQSILLAIFVGLVATAVIWFIKLINEKVRSKEKIRIIIKENKEVPTLIAFLPWVFINAYMIMGIVL